MFAKVGEAILLVDIYSYVALLLLYLLVGGFSRFLMEIKVHVLVVNLCKGWFHEVRTSLGRCFRTSFCIAKTSMPFINVGKSEKLSHNCPRCHVELVPPHLVILMTSAHTTIIQLSQIPG